MKHWDNSAEFPTTASTADGFSPLGQPATCPSLEILHYYGIRLWAPFPKNTSVGFLSTLLHTQENLLVKSFKLIYLQMT